MQANPILAEAFRGNWVENRHRGTFSVVDDNGKIVASIGDYQRPVFPRSAIKSLQAMAMFRSGAVEKFGLDDEEIALACASHNGESAHVEGVQRFLDKIGCSIDDLECGAHPPSHSAARKALQKSGNAPSAIHNNCSGKHSGMLAVAKALGVPTKDYSKRVHPVQKLVREVVERIIGQELTEDRCGLDGCSIPTWAAPLNTFAEGFARMASGNGLPDEMREDAFQIFDAATKNPFLIRGTDSLDTDLMTAFGGRLMIKIGADGVFCGALRDKSLGFALKIDDGNLKVAEVVIAQMLTVLSQPNDQEAEVLSRYATSISKNWRKLEVGRIVATTRVAEAF